MLAKKIHITTLTKKLALYMGLVPSLCLAQTLAFPSAEGFGRFTTGGRGGEVYHVTNLNDSGTGSFRDAVSKSGRIVVFDVGGVIKISSRIVIQKNTYVAGQTAPGGGITIYGNGVALNSSSGNTIVRYLRIRMGDQGDSRKDALGISDGQNYIFDNVSVSWGHDGTLDVNGSNIDNITFQDCIISQGIDIVGHSTGGLFQSGKWSMIRSLYIDNETRNPKGKGTHEFINNVIYNWGSDGYIMGATTGLSEVNMIGNHFIYGPSSSNGSHITRTTPEFHVYAKDNWVDSNKDGVYNPSLMSDYKTATLVDTPFDYHGTQNAKPAKEALDELLSHVGGTPHDAVDLYLLDELKSYGTKGKIIVRESENGIPGNVGTVANGIPPKDTDRDGMPDSWETLHGLDPNSHADQNGFDLSDEGYTNVEMYLNELAGDPVKYKDNSPTNYPPVFVTGDSLSVNENSTEITPILVSDPENATITYSIGTGSDSEFFTIDPHSGVLRFKTAPDYETPTDGGLNNIYWVYIKASDGIHEVEQKTAVHVTDVNEEVLWNVKHSYAITRHQYTVFDMLGNTVLHLHENSNNPQQWGSPQWNQLKRGVYLIKNHDVSNHVMVYQKSN